MDKSTGFCLDGIEDRLDHAKWYCGNYYIVKCWRDENRPVHPVILSELALYEENILIYGREFKSSDFQKWLLDIYGTLQNKALLR